MPRKVKIAKEEIVKISLGLVRKHGEGAINARSVAAALNCSTQPVFSNFANIDELKKETTLAAYEIYCGFLKKEAESGKYPKYKSFGMGYIRFASEEKELFKLLFMRDRTGEDTSPTEDFEESVQLIMKANGLTREQARLMHLEIWSFVHGVGAMLATSFLTLDLDLISDMLTDVYQGIRLRFVSGDNKNGSN